MLELIDSSPLQFFGGALVLLLVLRHATRTGEWRVVFVIAWLITVLATVPAALTAPAGDISLLAWSEPWIGVLLVAVAVGIMMTVFYGILRPRTFDRSLDRLALATFFALAISLLFSPLRPDRSGAYYVVGWFSVVSAFVLLLVALTIMLRAPRAKRWRGIFGVVWLATVLGTMPAALVPPYWAGRGLVPYEPWTGVLLVSGAVGFMMIVLYAILRPGSFNRSWRRLVFAILFTLAMTFLFSPLQLHVSGSFYAVGWFSVFSTCLLLLIALALAGGSIRRRWRSQVWSSR